MIACARCGAENAETSRFCSSCGNALSEATVPAQMAEVRKTVTVMFADVVGSTGIGERTDPESLRRVMTRYFAEIKTIVERHGGIVEKFIGDAVMAVFGVPVVHEDDALRAVRAAAEMRARLRKLDADLERERGMSVAWRTGINTGEVVAGDAGSGQTFVTGDAVNVAARLEQAAKTSEILIGGETLRLVRDAVAAEPIGRIEVRGRSVPVEAHRLIDVVAEREPRVRVLRGPMIGRDRQRRLLTDAFEQVIAERTCHLFTVLGPAGVGKSRLVREFLADIGERAQILTGRCLSYGEGITYWPIAELIREAAGLADSDDDSAVRDKIGALIDDERDRAAAVQRLGEILGRFEGTAVQEETFWGVKTTFESLARRRALVVVIEDVHWAEPTLLDLIEHLADWIRESPLLLICLARQELLESRPGWGGGKLNATTLSLEPLNELQSRELVASLVGTVGLRGSLAQKISAAAEGNPLYVEEMVGMLIDSHVLVPSNGSWAATGDLERVDVPPTIQALLGARLDSLPEPERAVLERASVEGNVFHEAAIAELAPAGLGGPLGLNLRSLVRKELIRPDRSDFQGEQAFRFRHLLIRDTAYGALPKETRSDLHARFAAWLERITGDRITEYEEIVGYHYEQAFRYRTELGPFDDEARRLADLAGRHLGASGMRAIDRGDVRAARKLLTSAVELLPRGDAQRIRLSAELGLCMSLAGEIVAADSLLADTIAEADAAEDRLGRAHAEVVRIDATSSLGVVPVEEIIMHAERLLRIFDESGERRGAERAALELARHHFFAGRAKLAEEILLSRISTYERAEAPLMMMRWVPTVMTAGPTPVEDAIRWITENTDLAGNPVLAGESLAPLGILRAWVGDVDEGRRIVQRGFALSDEVGMRRYAMALAGNYLGHLELVAGRPEQAVEVLRSSYEELSGTGDRGFSASIAGHLARAYLELRRYDDAEHYARIARETATSDDVDAQARGLAVAARVEAASGNVTSAIALARQSTDMVDGTDYFALRAETYSDLAVVLAAAGDRDGAARALQRALKACEAKGATFLAEHVRRRADELSLRVPGLA